MKCVLIPLDDSALNFHLFKRSFMRHSQSKVSPRRLLVRDSSMCTKGRPTVVCHVCGLRRMRLLIVSRILLRMSIVWVDSVAFKGACVCGDSSGCDCAAHVFWP